MNNKEKEHSTWNLEARINRLPADQLSLVRNTVMHRASVSGMTYKRVLSEKSENVKVLKALAGVLNCTIDDVMNPEYKFQDPGLKVEPEQDTAAELGLSK